MNRHGLISALAAVLCGLTSAACQMAPSNTATAAPNLAGIWGPSFVMTLAPDPPMLPEARKLFMSQRGDDDPLATCKPPGVPRGTNMAFPFEIVQTPDIVYILLEYGQHTRRVFIGAQHPPREELDPTWFGHSIGHWEGNTLVVDTIGFNDITWLDMAGHLHSEDLRVIERYTRSPDGQELTLEVTIDDPKMYSKPWSAAPKTHALRQDIKLQEFVCEP